MNPGVSVYLQPLLCALQRPLRVGQRGVQLLRLLQAVLELLLQGLQDLLLVQGRCRSSPRVSRGLQVPSELLGALLQLLHVAALSLQGGVQLLQTLLHL